MRTVRAAVADRALLRAMRQSATATALTLAFREWLALAEGALLTASYPEIIVRGDEPDG